MTNARALSARLADLLRAEQVAMADFLLALADFDRRRLWVDLGYANLFAYLHRELGLSRSAAHYRKTAVELIER
ncbi:MAG TPA: HNH endonuclease, partial [Anaeromyxobacter sp.]